MATAYNIRNKLFRSSLADRSARLDPGSAGTIIVGPVDRAVVELSGAGTRTLEPAAGVGLGTTILCLSQTAAIIVTGAVSVTIGDGEYVEFVCTNNSAGVHQWVVKTDTNAATNVVTAAAAADAAGEVWVSNGTDRALVPPTSVDVTGNTSAYVESIITDILGVLEAAGLITDSTTT